MDVTVCVGTFGESKWADLAQDAISSVPEGVPVIHSHLDEGTLAQTRNAALNQVETEWVIHLDADDRLGGGYIEAMETGTADLRGPAIRQWRSGRAMTPIFMPSVNAHHDHDCEAACLRLGNWLVVGTCVRTELVLKVGGWEEFGWSEDWALWARCWKAGGTVEAIPEAIYEANWSKQSRNRVDHDTAMYWHREIEKAVWPEEEPRVGAIWEDPQ